MPRGFFYFLYHHCITSITISKGWHEPRRTGLTPCGDVGVCTACRGDIAVS